MAALTDRYEQFRQAGARIVVVNPDDTERTREFLQRAGERTGDQRVVAPPFPMVFDESGDTQRRWGVWHTETFRGREYPQPIAATFVVDRAGQVRFKHVAQGGVAHGDRPDPDLLLAVVRYLASK